MKKKLKHEQKSINNATNEKLTLHRLIYQNIL